MAFRTDHRGDLRACRAQAHRRRRLAGLRRPGGRRIGAPRPPGDHRVVEGRPRCVDDHLVGARVADGGPTRRLPGDPPGRPLLGVPADHAVGSAGTDRTGDGLVEIWNGMPFFSPLWSHCPQIVFLHHVHAEMWKMVLPSGMAECGYAIEHRLAPPGLPAEPDRHPVRFLEAGDRRASAHPCRTGCRCRLRASSPSSTPPASARRSRWWWRSGVWCRSSASTC